MIELVRNLKAKYGLKIMVVSNESRELNAHRISTFKLAGFVDAFISSCFVHLRNRTRIFSSWRWTSPRLQHGRIVYIENTPLFVQIAEGFGIRSILHTDYKSTCAKLAAFGLQNDVIHETH